MIRFVIEVLLGACATAGTWTATESVAWTAIAGIATAALVAVGEFLLDRRRRLTRTD